MNNKFFLIATIIVATACTSPGNQSVSQSANNQPKNKEPEIPLAEQIQSILQEVSKPFDPKVYNEYDADLDYSKLKFKEWADVIRLADTCSNKETKKMAAALKSKVVAHQQKAYPVLRKAYVERKAAKLWEEDIEVFCEGAGCNTITLVAAAFASNKNIKATEQILSPILHDYRFKRINFKWIRSDSEYTYYDYLSPKDGELFE